MTKPYRSKELYYKITRALGRLSESDNDRGSIETQYSTPLKALAAGDHSFELEMLNTMASSFAQDFDKLDVAVANADISSLKSTAHRLKSSLALAGENEFAKWMEILEYNSETELRGETVKDAHRSIIAGRDNLLRRINQQIEDLKK